MSSRRAVIGALALALLLTAAAGAATAPVRFGVFAPTCACRLSAYFAPAGELRPFAGDVVVGSELRGLYWVVRPRGSGFVALPLPGALSGKKYNLEGAIYVAG